MRLACGGGWGSGRTILRAGEGDWGARANIRAKRALQGRRRPREGSGACVCLKAHCAGTLAGDARIAGSASLGRVSSRRLLPLAYTLHRHLENTRSDEYLPSVSGTIYRSWGDVGKAYAGTDDASRIVPSRQLGRS